MTKRSGFIQALLASLKAPGHCQEWGLGAGGVAIFNLILLDNSQEATNNDSSERTAINFIAVRSAPKGPTEPALLLIKPFPDASIPTYQALAGTFGLHWVSWQYYSSCNQLEFA
ncbi:MAG: hypothetical protein HS126_03285 [Anaerolineales bacterium]|nr:hypothetical protein [Anaerolineales bacterium]